MKCFHILGTDDFDSSSITSDFHQAKLPWSTSRANVTTNDCLLPSLENWVKHRMKNGPNGNDLTNMIASEVSLQNRGIDQDQNSSTFKNRLTPEKMKLVAPAILSKILQSEGLNR